jgi:putative DNA primase/helicase
MPDQPTNADGPASDAEAQARADGEACLAEALDLASLNWSIIPIYYGCKNPVLRTWKPYQSQRATQEEIQAWWRDWPRAGLAVVLGRISSLCRIDADCSAAEEMLATLAVGDLPITVEFTTGRGRGLLYRLPTSRRGVFKTKAQPVEGGELRFQAEGSYCVLPPSWHLLAKRHYAWVEGRSPHEIDVAFAPDWLLGQLRPSRARTNGHAAERPRDEDGGGAGAGDASRRIPEGRRDNTLASLAGTMRRRGMTPERIAAALRTENERRCDPPLPNEDVDRIARSVGSYPPGGSSSNGDGNNHGRGEDDQAPRPQAVVHDTELGNAQRVAIRYPGRLRHCFPWKKWLAWDGRSWRSDDTAAVTRCTKQVVRELFLQTTGAIAGLDAEPMSVEARKAEFERLGKRVNWTLRCEEAKHINAVLDLLRSEPGIPILSNQLDRDPWLLNLSNGTLELNTSTLRAHRREDYITKSCSVKYDADSEAPLFSQFLRDIFADNQELIDYVQRFFGYCLTGDVREQILPVFYGAGANGKTTLINAVMGTLGEDYAIQANRDLFMAKKGDTHPAQMARLFGKRLVVCVESQEGARLDEGLVKELTGGDKIAARRMREDWWEFFPTHKAILVTNHKPEIRGTDNAIWRRLRLVPFTVVFPEAQQDKTLGESLKDEAPGILRWMVEGCEEWQRQGLGTPAVVTTATPEYRTEQDRLGAFIAEKCVKGPEYSIKIKVLYSAYKQWCEVNNERPGTGKAFGDAMREREFKKDSGDRNYLGVQLKQEQPDEGALR